MNLRKQPPPPPCSGSLHVNDNFNAHRLDQSATMTSIDSLSDSKRFVINRHRQIRRISPAGLKWHRWTVMERCSGLRRPSIRGAFSPLISLEEITRKSELQTACSESLSVLRYSVTCSSSSLLRRSAYGRCLLGT
jgi:hypothetical protein